MKPRRSEEERTLNKRAVSFSRMFGVVLHDANGGGMSLLAAAASLRASAF